MNPKISIITVSFNASKTIEATIKSVLSQSYKNIEYIIVDGKSTDDTLEIIKKYKKRITKVISKKDKGLYDAMNKGVKNCTGDYVFFLNADDVFKDMDVVRKIAKEFDENVDFVFGDVEFFYPDEKKCVRISREASISELKKGNMPPHQGTFVKKDLLEKYPFDLNYFSSADFDFFSKIIINGAKSKKLDFVVAINTIGGVSSGSISYKETEEIVKKNFGMFNYLSLLMKHRLLSNIKIVFNKFGIKIHKG
ncbi:MAG: glycosyltransferase family 2 protein [Candidatus Iainarchaeum sp.]|jgi:glycosyltransferase involved in cell wall biosynthesis|nr:MAG: Glycosyltransferase AglE [archaeon ADurb.Bin336]